MLGPLDSWLLLVLDQFPGGVPPARRKEYLRLVEASAELQDGEGFAWDLLPSAIQQIFSERGWAWNGIYVRQDQEMHLAAAAGPPVCHSLELSSALGGGMCSDAVLLNQTVAADRVKDWPGYVSCDGESGLLTRAGLVCPIRGPSGAPAAVWDLDTTEALAPTDPFFMDRFFATLSARHPFPVGARAAE